MPIDPVIDKLQAYLDKHPDASDDDVARDIPELSDVNKRHAAFGYVRGLANGNAPSRMDKMFPQFATQQPTQRIDLSQAPTIHGTMPTQATEAKTATPVVNTQTQTSDQKYVATQNQAVQDHEDNVNKYNTDDVIKHLNAKALQENQDKVRKQYEAKLINQDQYMQGMHDVYQQFLHANANVPAIKAEVPNNPELQDHILNAAQDLYPDDAGNIKAARYLGNRVKRYDNGAVQVPTNANQVLVNANKIKNQEYDYDGQNVIKPLNPVESFAHAIQTSTQAKNNADWLMSASDDDVIKHYRDQFNSQNPDEPVSKPSHSLGSFTGDLIGSMTPVSVKQAVLGTLASKIPVVGPIVSPVLSAVAGADDIRKQTYSQVFDASMNDALKNGEDPTIAVKKARHDATTHSMADFIAMSAMGGIPEGKFLHDVNIPLTPGVSGAAKYATQTLAKNLAEKTPGAAANALLLGSSQVAKNAMDGNNGNDLYEGVSDQMLMGGGLHYMTALLSPLMEGEVPQKFRSAILQNMHKIPIDMQEKVFQDLEHTGSMSPEDALKVKSEIAERGALDSQVDPRVINDDDRVKIANKIKTLNAARERLSTLDKSYNDESAKADIKAREEEIRNLTEESVAKSRDINKINKTAAQSVADEELGPEHEKLFADEIKNQNETNAAGSIRTEGQSAQSDNGSNGANAGAPKEASDSKRIPPESEAKSSTNDGGQAANSNSEIIKPTSDYRTANIGNHEGKQEFIIDNGKLNKDDDHQTALKKQQVENIQKWNVPLDEGTDNPNGETMAQAVGRVVGRYEQDKQTAPDNTAIIAHSSVLKIIKTYEELHGTPEFKNADWHNLTPEQHKAFTDHYTKESTNNGDIETFDSNAGKIHIVRHGQTEDNLNGKFRDDNTKLTAKGKKQAAVAGEELSDKGDIPQIITSDLPRAVDTANIINDKLKGKSNPISNPDEWESILKSKIDKSRPVPEPALAKHGEAKPLEEESKPIGQYSTPTRALETIQSEHPDDVQLNRAAEFMKPILKDRSDIQVRNKTLEPGKLGQAHPDGKIDVDFSQHSTNKAANETIAHELMHQATRNELETNKPFRAAIDKILNQIRSKLGLPQDDEVMRKGMQMLSNSGRDISENYGLTNAHELLAETFTNPKMLSKLKGMEAPGTEHINMLQKIFRTIVGAFDSKYKALQEVKGNIKANDMADYLMQLTEKTVKSSGDAGTTHAKVGDAERAAIVNMIRRAPDNMSDTEMHQIISKHSSADPDEITKLIDQNRRDLRDDAALTPEAKIAEAKEIGARTTAQAKKNPLMPKPEAAKAAGLGKILKRWYGDGQDDVSMQKSIIRKNMGNAEQQLESTWHASNDMTDYWNKVKENNQLGFILSMENLDDLQHEPQEIKDMAADYRTRLDRVWSLIASVKGSVNYLQDYFPHFWKKPDEVKNFFAESASKAPMEGSKSFLKQRFYATILDGYRKGYELATTNPEELVRLAEANAWKFKSAHDIVKDMKAQGLLKYAPANEIPAGWRKIDDPAFKRLTAYIDNAGDPKIAKGDYYTTPDVARLMKDYLSPGLKGPVINTVRNFNNVKNMFQLGVGAFHFGTTTIDNAVSMNALGIAKLTQGKVLGGAIDLIKGSTILPAAIENVARGLKAKRDYQNNNITADVQHLIDVNAKVGKNKMYSLDSWYNMKKAFYNITKGEGTAKDVFGLLGHALTLIPEAINKPLMERYVPALKVGGYLNSVHAEIKARPDMTPAELQTMKEKRWDDMDNRLGQVVYDNQFMNKSLKDLGFAGVRSMGWTGGTIKTAATGIGEIPLSAKRLFKGRGISQRTAYMISLPLTVGFFGGMYHYMNTGQPPQTLDDYFHPKDGTINEDGTENRVSLPTYMKDFVSYSRHPFETLSHKVSPMVTEAYELYNNKDFYGEQVWNPDDPIYKKGLEMLNYEAKSFVPFSVKTNSRDENQPTQQKVQKFVGVMPAPKETEHTDMENKINTESVKQNGRDAEGKTHEKMEKNIARYHLSQYIHDGGTMKDADPDLVQKAEVTDKGKTEFIKEAKLDQFVRKFNHLSDKAKVNLFNQMSDDEKEKYDPHGKIQKLADKMKDDNE